MMRVTSHVAFQDLGNNQHQPTRPTPSHLEQLVPSMIEMKLRRINVVPTFDTACRQFDGL